MDKVEQEILRRANLGQVHPSSVTASTNFDGRDVRNAVKRLLRAGRLERVKKTEVNGGLQWIYRKPVRDK